LKLRIETIDGLEGISAPAWDALAQGHPLLRHAFLHALHSSGSATAETGWHPQYLVAWEGERLVGAMPLYVKSHSYGEYVFDWAWAEAYQRHGLDYFPKLLSAIPFSPCTGSRLLSASDAVKRALLDSALTLAREADVSSLHVLLPTAHEATLLQAAGMMPRQSVQFHWRNAGYTDFDAFLATLTHDKRKKLKQERRKVSEAGVTFRWLSGRDLNADDWRFWNRCYRHTYRAHHSTPYLNLAFWETIGRDMPDNILMVIGERDRRTPPRDSHGKGVSVDMPENAHGKDNTSPSATREPICASLCIHNDHTLYGRYWGVEPTAEFVPGLHFEACYYQPIAFCIDRRLEIFEGGAQGQHKLARGLMPVTCHSAHWLKHPQLARAVGEFLARERSGVAQYVDELNEHAPFKAIQADGQI
jgi:uncharacterized protein